MNGRKAAQRRQEREILAREEAVRQELQEFILKNNEIAQQLLADIQNGIAWALRAYAIHRVVPVAWHVFPWARQLAHERLLRAQGQVHPKAPLLEDAIRARKLRAVMEHE